MSNTQKIIEELERMAEAAVGIQTSKITEVDTLMSLNTKASVLAGYAMFKAQEMVAINLQTGVQTLTSTTSAIAQAQNLATEQLRQAGRWTKFLAIATFVLSGTIAGLAILTHFKIL